MLFITTRTNRAQGHVLTAFNNKFTKISTREPYYRVTVHLTLSVTTYLILQAIQLLSYNSFLIRIGYSAAYLAVSSLAMKFSANKL